MRGTLLRVESRAGELVLRTLKYGGAARSALGVVARTVHSATSGSTAGVALSSLSSSPVAAAPSSAFTSDGGISLGRRTMQLPGKTGRGTIAI